MAVGLDQARNDQASSSIDHPRARADELAGCGGRTHERDASVLDCHCLGLGSWRIAVNTFASTITMSGSAAVGAAANQIASEMTNANRMERRPPQREYVSRNSTVLASMTDTAKLRKPVGT
jgi:hypothetical protein